MTVAKRKSPKLKKLDRYEKEHRTVMENPHAFRANWPKKKARGNRQRRRKEVLAISRNEADDIAGEVRIARRGITVKKSNTMNLQQFIDAKQRKRKMRPILNALYQK